MADPTPTITRIITVAGLRDYPRETCEVDLSDADPPIISRLSIICMEPGCLGIDALWQSWVEKLPLEVPIMVKKQIIDMVIKYVDPTIAFMHAHYEKVAPTVDNNLAESIMNILDSYVEAYQPAEGKPPPTDLMIADLITCIDAVFMFALVWSVGAITHEGERGMYDIYLRTLMFANNFPFPFPKNATVYDFHFLLDAKEWVPLMPSKLSFLYLSLSATDR